MEEDIVDAEYPFQIDLPYEITKDILSRIVKFCEPHDVWSAPFIVATGNSCGLGSRFKDAQAARNFRRKFDGEVVG